MSERVRSSEIGLLDALCTWERDTGHGSILILLRADSDSVLLAQDGKPIQSEKFYFDFLVKQLRERLGY